MAKRDNLRRRPPFRAPLPRVLIVCEGTRTEPAYFRETRHLNRSLIDLEIRPGGVPKTLVERAVALKQSAAKEAKSQKDDNLSYDSVWCVFDIDEHPFVPEAKQKAKDNNIEVAISNPCFELWVLLHYRDQRAHIDRSSVQSECRKYIPGYDKELPTARLFPHYAEALRRARELDVWQLSRGCDGENPSTGVYRLMEQIKSRSLASD